MEAGRCGLVRFSFVRGVHWYCSTLMLVRRAYVWVMFLFRGGSKHTKHPRTGKEVEINEAGAAASGLETCAMHMSFPKRALI